MMMELEIEKTKEAINGITQACETVEKVLGNVIHSEGMSELFKEVSPQDEGDESNKMEDVISEPVTATTAMSLKIGERKWFEHEELLALWNNNGV